jgi:hypothetical protein
MIIDGFVNAAWELILGSVLVKKTKNYALNNQWIKYMKFESRIVCVKK